MLTPGTKLGGRYRLDERIAGGGMGDVWRGTDEVLGRTVAIKVLLQSLMEEPGFAERFRAEARTMATINHPGVVDVYDYGNEQETAFLIMEYVEGDALARTLSKVSRLTPARTMALIAQAGDALEAAHAKGIVHRDVKPGNLLVRPDGTLVLTDFGIARSAAAAQLTAAGSVLGTASYISPEQAAGQQATALSDVYALGVVAYQCLAGHRPFEGDNPLEIAMRHVRDTPPPMPPDIPPAVRQIVERAMAKDPAARWQSASALASVSRTVANQLASGKTATVDMPTSPAPGTGTSVMGVPPMPTSGIPTSAVPGSPAGPTATRALHNPATGGFSRGASGIPPHPPHQDRPGYPQARPGSGYPGQDQRRGSQNTTMVMAAVAVIAVLLLGGLGLYAWASDDESGSQEGPTASSAPLTTGVETQPEETATTAGPTRTQTTSQQISAGCNELEGQLQMVVSVELQNRGFNTIKIEKVHQGGVKNTVISISPCQATVDETITLTVTTGNDGAGNNDDGEAEEETDTTPTTNASPSANQT